MNFEKVKTRKELVAQYGEYKIKKKLRMDCGESGEIFRETENTGEDIDCG